MFSLSLHTSVLAVVICRALFVLQLGLLGVSIVCESKFLLSWCSSIISDINHLMLSTSISGIPRNAVQSPGSTRNLHLTHLSLCVNFTVHIPICLITDWNDWFIFCGVNLSYCRFWRQNIYNLNSIRLPSLLVPIFSLLMFCLDSAWLKFDEYYWSYIIKIEISGIC